MSKREIPSIKTTTVDWVYGLRIFTGDGTELGQTRLGADAAVSLATDLLNYAVYMRSVERQKSSR